MDPTQLEWTVAVFLAVLLLGMVVLTHLGRRVGARRLAVDPAGASAGTAAIEGAVFALMTLLVTFTFFGAADRFAARRTLIVAEANAMSTTYLRLDLVPTADRSQLQRQFRIYADSRIAAYRALPDWQAWEAALARSNTLQRALWRDVMAALSRTPDAPATLLLVPSLNEMIDLTTTRSAALRTHPSPVVFVLLGVLALACAFVAGMGMAKSSTPNRLHIYGFSVLIVTTLAVILDYEFPRLGIIRIDRMDQVLVDVREQMH